MKTILLFLILIALTVNHPMHMIMLVGIAAGIAVCFKDEKKTKRIKSLKRIKNH